MRVQAPDLQFPGAPSPPPPLQIPSRPPPACPACSRRAVQLPCLCLSPACLHSPPATAPRAPLQAEGRTERARLQSGGLPRVRTRLPSCSPACYFARAQVASGGGLGCILSSQLGPGAGAASGPQPPLLPTPWLEEARRGDAGAPAGGHGKCSAAAAVRLYFCRVCLEPGVDTARLQGFSAQVEGKQTWVLEPPRYLQLVNHQSVLAKISWTCYIATQVTWEIYIHCNIKNKNT